MMCSGVKKFCSISAVPSIFDKAFVGTFPLEGGAGSGSFVGPVCAQAEIAVEMNRIQMQFANFIVFPWLNRMRRRLWGNRKARLLCYTRAFLKRLEARLSALPSRTALPTRAFLSRLNGCAHGR